MSKSAVVFTVLLAGLTCLVRPLHAGFVDPDPVAVASTASEEYAQQKFGPGAPKPESYLFFQGKFFGGTTRDPNLEHAQFNSIVKILAENMVRQNYFPTNDPKKTDLLIVVHWGTTTVYENPNAQDDLQRKNDAIAAEQAAGPSMDHGAINQELAIADLEQGTEENSINYNARLLGFREEIAKASAKSTASSNGVTDEEMGLKLALSEERYFIILMAYDFRTMKKGTPPKLLWSTRFSIRSPGNSFTGVLPVMSRVAADYFGHPLDGLKIEQPNARTGKVDVGVPKVVGDGR